jgi:TRAP-type uncharacterized transport system substrate-binding protein
MSIIEKGVCAFLIEELKDFTSSIDLNNYVRQSYIEDGYSDYEIDHSGIEDELESLLDSIISDFDDGGMDYLDIDRSDIVANIDINKIESDFIDSWVDNYDDDYRINASSYSNPENDIEAIFERS